MYIFSMIRSCWSNNIQLTVDETLRRRHIKCLSKRSRGVANLVVMQQVIRVAVCCNV